MLKFFLLFILCTLSSLYAAHPEIDAAIFDCDGVLVDTEHLKFLAWQTALASKNISFSIEEYMPLVGHSSLNILRMIGKLKNISIAEEVIGLQNAEYRLLQKQGVPPIAQMVTFVQKLSQERKRLGIKLGLVSSASKEEILQNLKQIGLENSFDLIISGTDDLKGYSDKEGTNKPKPYIYIEASKRLKVSPPRCLVFEDTTAGIEAAAGAGMIAIAVPNQLTLQQDFSKASKVIPSCLELSLEEILKKIGAKLSCYD